MLWEQFRSLALPIIREHFPPELIKDNGDSIVFTSRRDGLKFRLAEENGNINIGYYGERNTIETFCSTPSHELATVCLKLLARDGMDEFVDITYTPRELLGPVPDTVFSISKDHLPFFQLTSTINPTVSATCRSFACARAIAEAYSLQHPQAQTSQPRC